MMQLLCIRTLWKCYTTDAYAHSLVSCIFAREQRRLTDMFVQDDVVSKPFRIPELVPKIEELLVKYPMPTRTTNS